MRTISIKVGLWMFAGFAGFFLLMFILGLAQHSELRVFNGVIQIACLYYAIRAYYDMHPENIENYMSGVTQGMGVSLVGVGAFSIFISIFLALNPPLMETIRQNSYIAGYLTPFTASIFMVTEGIAVGLIGSYILTRVIQMNIKRSL